MATSRAWSERPLDLLYFVFFVVHAAASVLCDLQFLVPIPFAPEIVRNIPRWYVETSNDIVMAGAAGLKGPAEYWVWIRTILVLEAVFQLPSVMIGAYAMWKDSKVWYPLLLAYSATAVTTTVAVLATDLKTPIVDYPPAQGELAMTHEQLITVLSGLVPFMIIPTVMVFDLGFRVTDLVRKGLAAELRAKRK